jgi:hypothetical protein
MAEIAAEFYDEMAIPVGEGGEGVAFGRLDAIGTQPRLYSKIDTKTKSLKGS